MRGHIILLCILASAAAVSPSFVSVATVHMVKLRIFCVAAGSLTSGAPVLTADSHAHAAGHRSL